MTETARTAGALGTDAMRIDKWLWHARFVKSRSLATKLCQSGRIRVNAALMSKPRHQVRPGDVLTFPLGPHIRVVRILGLASRRGPAVEARTLYEELAPAENLENRNAARPARRPLGAGRPTKSDRRAIDDLMRGDRGRRDMTGQSND